MTLSNSYPWTGLMSRWQFLTSVDRWGLQLGCAWQVTHTLVLMTRFTSRLNVMNNRDCILTMAANISAKLIEWNYSRLAQTEAKTRNMISRLVRIVRATVRM